MISDVQARLGVAYHSTARCGRRPSALRPLRFKRAALTRRIPPHNEAHAGGHGSFGWHNTQTPAQVRDLLFPSFFSSPPQGVKENETAVSFRGDFSPGRFPDALFCRTASKSFLEISAFFTGSTSPTSNDTSPLRTPRLALPSRGTSPTLNLLLSVEVQLIAYAPRSPRPSMSHRIHVPASAAGIFARLVFVLSALVIRRRRRFF